MSLLFRPLMPNIKGKVPNDVEQELYMTFTNLNNIINQLVQMVSSQFNNSNSNSSGNNNSVLVGSQALPLIENPNQNEIAQLNQQQALTPSDIPDLDASKIATGIFPLARLDIKVLETDDGLTRTAGVPVAGGTIIIKDNDGHSQTVLVV